MGSNYNQEKTKAFEMGFKHQVAMFGPDLDVKGGISFVVLEYIKAGLSQKTKLTFIPTTKDCSKAQKVGFFLTALIKTIIWTSSNGKQIYHLHISQSGSFYRKFVLLIIAKLFKQKIVAHIHGSKFEEFINKNSFNRWLSYFMFNQADKVITLNEQWKNIVRKNVKKERVVKLYNPITSQEFCFKNKNHSGINVLFLGRLSKRKGTYDLLYCIKTLLNFFTEKNVKFFICGDGDIENVRSYTRKYRLNHVVSVPGWVTGKDKLSYLSKADIYVLPSYNEQMPMSILEAMGFGLPVISTFVGGIPEMVDSGENGILIAAGDKKALNEALKDLIEDSQKREKMGKKSLSIIKEKFNAKVVIEQLIKIYDSLQTV
jgi:glycosyltransferase involved in cell wall biosynthesis